MVDQIAAVNQIFGSRLHAIIHGHQRHILLIKKKGKYIFSVIGISETGRDLAFCMKRFCEQDIV